MSNDTFGRILLDWYACHGRQLPWRGTRDPYRIWVSEIILQQTRVVQGWDYYLHFIERFPDVRHLAEASEDEVLKCWQGLGYYSRARNLWRAAQKICGMPQFPTDYRTLLTLDGIGEYTAAAIASFAADAPEAVIDGNVYRVLSRFLGEPTPIDTTEGKKRFRELAYQLLDRRHPADYNQAIMDFGATQCIPKQPDCSCCPLADDCVALWRGMVEELPIKQKKKTPVTRYLAVIEIEHGQEVLLHRREAKDIWHGLYEPLTLEFSAQPTDRQVRQHETLQPFLDEGATLRCLKRGFKHVLTHRVILADYYHLTARGSYCPAGCFYAPAENDYAVSTFVRKIRKASHSLHDDQTSMLDLFSNQ